MVVILNPVTHVIHALNDCIISNIFKKISNHVKIMFILFLLYAFGERI